MDGDDVEEYGQAAMGGRRRGAGVKSIKADREKARRQRESDRYDRMMLASFGIVAGLEPAVCSRRQLHLPTDEWLRALRDAYLQLALICRGFHCRRQQACQLYDWHKTCLSRYEYRSPVLRSGAFWRISMTGRVGQGARGLLWQYMQFVTVIAFLMGPLSWSCPLCSRKLDSLPHPCLLHARHLGWLHC